LLQIVPDEMTDATSDDVRYSCTDMLSKIVALLTGCWPHTLC